MVNFVVGGSCSSRKKNHLPTALKRKRQRNSPKNFTTILASRHHVSYGLWMITQFYRTPNRSGIAIIMPVTSGTQFDDQGGGKAELN